MAVYSSKQSLYLLLVTVLTVDSALCARVLAVLPIPAHSHHVLFRAMLGALARAGHEVVSFTSLPVDRSPPNYTEVHLDNVKSMDKMMTLEEVMKMMTMSPVTAVPNMMWTDSFQVVQDTFKNKKFQELLNSSEHFDLVVLEALLAQEPLLGLGHRFNAPVVNVQPFHSYSLANKLAGNSLLLPYIPEFTFPYSDHMTFYERLLSAYSAIRTSYIYYNEYLPKQVEFTKKIYNDPTMPSLLDMVHNISLFVDNANPYVHYSRPYTPNTVSVGGIHLAKEQQPLPPDMKQFLDEAEHGVIYFSLGSLVPDHLQPQEYFDNFINVFRRLPQKVLWKTGSVLKSLPDNVMTSKWVPQQAVLAHANVVLFMTHGGLFSQHEAIHAGVPVVCTPYFGDQSMNAKFYEEKEVGVQLPYNTLSEETIYSAVTTVLNNPTYEANMRRMSRVYRDRPLSAADTLVFWVEYVLRHQGAQHLRPASAHMPWYQLALLDVLAVLLLAASAALLLLYLFCSKTVSWVRGATSNTSEKESRLDAISKKHN